MLMATSSLVVFLGLGVGWGLYGDDTPEPEAPDAFGKNCALGLGHASRQVLCG